VIHSAILYLGLNQRNHPVNECYLLVLVLSNFVNISLDYVEHGLVHPDSFHPLLLLILQYHFGEKTKILILPIKDILQGIMHYFIMPCLASTGLYCTLKYLLMLPLTD
jgi:hypothetical protein